MDNTYVYTVEGNTSSTSGVVANGGAVSKKKYKLNYDRLAGYGRPCYDTESEPEKDNGQGYILYTVKNSDTLWGIAERFYGKGTEWKKIAEANGLKNTVIRGGDVLKIPC